MTFIENWRQLWRMSSVWFQAVAAIFLSYLTAVPDAAIQIWLVLPEDIRRSIPPEYVQFGGIAFIVLGIFARVVKQPKLAREAGDTTAP